MQNISASRKCSIAPLFRVSSRSVIYKEPETYVEKVLNMGMVKGLTFLESFQLFTLFFSYAGQHYQIEYAVELSDGLPVVHRWDGQEWCRVESAPAPVCAAWYKNRDWAFSALRTGI